MGEPATYFGPYALVRPLGVGGMAETFVAKRQGPGGFVQRVCLKRVLPAFNQDPRFVEQFLQEARLAATLRHGNIVGVIDFGEHEGVYYMALELVEGCDLRQLMIAQPAYRVPVELTVQVILSLADALDYAHNAEISEEAHGLVHRDLSPGNVLLSRSGGVRLADFGIAKAMRGMSATASNVVKGKIPYMSPEQMRGEDLDGRADLFSLGVIAWEMLVGSRPFDGKNDVDTMGRIISGSRPSLAQLMPDLDRRLVEIIERLIHIDKEQRFASAEELMDALASVGGSPRAKRELGRRVCLINPKPDRTTGSMPARASVEPEPPSQPQSRPPAQTTPLEGIPAHPHPDTHARTVSQPPQPAPQSGSFDQWSSPGRTGPAPKRGLSPLAIIAMALGVAGVAVGATLGVQTLLSPTPPPLPTTTENTAPPTLDSTAPTAPPVGVQEPASVTASPEGLSATDQPIGDEADDAPRVVEQTPEPSRRRGTTPARRPAQERVAGSTMAPAQEPIPVRPVTMEPASAPPVAMQPAATGTGRVQVTIIPWGNFSIGGRSHGRAPQTVSLPVGNHRVTAHIEGQPPQSRSVRVRAGETSRVIFR